MVAAKPAEASYKGWFRELSRKTDIPIDSLEAYHDGRHECPGSRLLVLFRHFGPAFEAQVRGTVEPEVDTLAEIIALVDRHKRGRVS